MSVIDWSPLWISLHTAAATIAIVFFIGVIIAWRVERLQSQSLKIFADAVITLPMVLPPTVAGFFLLYFFGNNRFLGQLIYQLTGIKIAFSWLATVLAAAVISLPLMYRSARGALSQVDKGMLEAARSLGMTEWRIFWRIHLPNALPGIIAGNHCRQYCRTHTHAAACCLFCRRGRRLGCRRLVCGRNCRHLPISCYRS